MKSRTLIEKTRKLQEGGITTPPGVTSGGGAPDPEEFNSGEPRPGRSRPGGPRGPGGPGEGTKQGSEVALLRDAFLLTLATNNGERELADQLMAGQMPDPGQIQHILDEAGPIADSLPEPMKKGLGVIYKRLRGGAA